MAAVMQQLATPPAARRLLLSGNDAVARAVWESGVRVAAAYPGTPATEMLHAVEEPAAADDVLANAVAGEPLAATAGTVLRELRTQSFLAELPVSLDVSTLPPPPQ